MEQDQRQLLPGMRQGNDLQGGTLFIHFLESKKMIVGKSEYPCALTCSLHLIPQAQLYLWRSARNGERVVGFGDLP